MTENDFRNNAESRKELEDALNCRGFRDAVEILLKRRQTYEAGVEANLAIDPIASVRLSNQRVGADGLLNDLRDLCNPIKLVPQQPDATFGADEEAAKLRELEERE